jgi:chaperonin GroEL (HSP60 family)
MAKVVVFDVEAREALQRGMDVLADAVRVTLGAQRPERGA